MSIDDSDAGGLADFTATLHAGGYGVPQPDASGHLGHSHGVGGVSKSVRTAVHRGHEIQIETTYAITIDGKPLEGGVEVLDNGAVHYHGLPQYALPSAIDMCKRVLDYFGTEPPASDDLGCLIGEHGDHCDDGAACAHDGQEGQNAAAHDHAGHDHAEHEHAEHEHVQHDHAEHGQAGHEHAEAHQ